MKTKFYIHVTKGTHSQSFDVDCLDHYELLRQFNGYIHMNDYPDRVIAIERVGDDSKYDRDIYHYAKDGIKYE